jgi:hypothetical protein
MGKKTSKEIVKAYCEYFKTKVIILLEHDEQVKDCSEWFNEIKCQKQVVALTPFAMYELDKHNIPYKILEDYYEPQELYRLGIANYKKLENICEIIDKQIQQSIPIIDEIEITPALFSMYHLKILYDAVTVRLFQLLKVIDAEKPDVVFTYDSKLYPFGIAEMAPYLLFDNRESIYTQLLSLPDWKETVVVLPHIPQPKNAYYSQTQKKKTTFKEKFVQWLQSYPNLFDLALAIKNKNWQRLPKPRVNKDSSVLIFGVGYNWEDSINDLHSVGLGRIFRMRDNLESWLSEPFSEGVDASALHNIWKRLQLNDKFRNFFIWENINFFPLVDKRLQFLIERLTFACINAYKDAESLQKKNSIKALLAPTFSTCTGQSVAMAAKKNGIPVIVWQHGGHGHINYPVITYTDLMPSDFHFVFGEGFVEHNGENAKRFNTKLVVVGSASLDALNKRKEARPTIKKLVGLNSNKKVLYATTIFYQNNHYIYGYPPFSDRCYWTTQKSIMDILGMHREYTAVIKVHPALVYRESPMRVYSEDKGFDNCQFIRNECGFPDLLPIADVIVIDFPSTILLQALTMSKPIFLYLGHLNIDKKVESLFKRRTYCYSDLNEFTQALDTFLSSGSIDMEADLNDRAFLKMYGTHLDDGKSGVRAANALRNIINESKLDR